MNRADRARQRVVGVHRYHFTTYLALLGIAASLVLFLVVRRWEHAAQRSEFESWTQTYASSVQSTLAQYVGALRFVSDVFEISPEPVTRPQFTNYARNILPRYPGIRAFGWDPLVKDVERASVERAAKDEGFPDFEFTERADSGELVRAARRDEYVIVQFIHPLKNNERAFGFDIASDPTRRKAIKRAFLTGELVATERITLVQETGNQYGILLLQPIYHHGANPRDEEDRWNSRQGFVVEVLRIGDVIETALAGLSDAGINITLHDMSAGEDARFLYHRSSGMAGSNDLPLPELASGEGLSRRHRFEFAGRQWMLAMAPSEVFYQSRTVWHSWAVLLGSLLLTALSTVLLRRERLYAAEIEQRSDQQAQTNRQLEAEIKERTLAEAERDKTIVNLKTALDEVDVLRGILPICSFCKRVRDDEGYWEQVEVYVRKHSQASFSHGICPTCVSKHYPEISTDLPVDQE